MDGWMDGCMDPLTDATQTILQAQLAAELKSIDVCLLQETHSTDRDEATWRNEWGGDILYSHGGHDSRGVMIIIKFQIRRYSHSISN
jgi:exonuclease III